MSKFTLLGALALGMAIIAPGLEAKPVKKGVAAAAAGWENRISLSAEGYPLWGNPNAPVKLIEFISYTCPLCADFSVKSSEDLSKGLVRAGKVSVELRPFVRNVIDVIPSMLVMCSPKARAFNLSKSILATQRQWFKEPADPTYQERWAALEGNNPALRKQVAKDMNLYALALGPGTTRAQIDTCLADEQLSQRLLKATDDAVNVTRVEGTPSFVINGKLQAVYGWAPLKPLLETAVAAAPVAVR